MKTELLKFINEHTRIPGATETPPQGARIVDVSLHRVTIVGNPDPKKLAKLIEDGRNGTDILDGRIHQLPNIIHWLGSGEKKAVSLMALMSATGLADLQTPTTLLPERSLSAADETHYRNMGLLWVTAKLTDKFRTAMLERGQVPPPSVTASARLHTTATVPQP